MEQPKNKNYIKWFSFASVITLLVSFFIYWNNAKQQQLKEQQQAVYLLKSTHNALKLLSKELNNGKEGVSKLSEYQQTKNKIFKK